MGDTTVRTVSRNDTADNRVAADGSSLAMGREASIVINDAFGTSTAEVVKRLLDTNERIIGRFYQSDQQTSPPPPEAAAAVKNLWPVYIGLSAMLLIAFMRR